MLVLRCSKCRFMIYPTILFSIVILMKFQWPPWFDFFRLLGASVLNSMKNVNLKHDNFMQLSSELNRLYPNFSFEIVSIVLGATGPVTSTLRKKNIEKCGIVNINDTLAKCQQMQTVGDNEDSKIGYENKK